MRGDKHGGHAGTYIAVWISLLILTATTVWVSYYNFGTLNILVAMLVATIKGSLVCLYFMHLRYDNRVNQVVFVSAFFFLAIFVGLTASDELFRERERPPTIAKKEEGAVDIAAMLAGSPELMKKGETIFANQCSVCHGPQGKGDGPGGKTMPPARDFTSGYWHHGGGVARVFRTITEGSPGTAMAAWGETYSVEERFGLAHFVRAFGPNKEEDKPEDVAWVKEKFGSKESAANGSTPAAAPSGPKIPIAFAMQRVAKPSLVSRDEISDIHTSTTTLGGKIYQASCQQCHGLHGRGGIAVKVISKNPLVYLKTKDFSQSQEGWIADRSQFVKIVSQGLPGSGKPGIADFSSQEWDELYRYVQALRQP